MQEKNKYFLYILLFVLALTSCTEGNRINKTLDVIDTMLTENPDSAYKQLQTMSAEIAGEGREVKMRYALLTTDAKNKCYVSLRDDSVMNEVVQFYDAWGTKEEKLRALYLQGCVYRDMHDSPSALRCYNDALEIADTTSDKCDYKFVTKIYGQMTYIYKVQRSPELLIETARRYRHYAEKTNNVREMLVADENVINGFDLMGMEDSVIVYIERLAKTYRAKGLDGDATYMFPLSMRIYLNRGDIANAKRMMNDYETKSGLFRDNAIIVKDKESYYSEKGLYYEKIGKLDSAEYFYSKMKNSIYINCRLEAFKGLTSIMKKRGDYAKGMEYASRYCQLTDSMTIFHSAEEVNRMTALYNYNMQNEKRERAEKRSKTYRNALIATMVLVFGALYVMMNYNARRKRRMLDDMKATNTKYISTLNMMNKAQDELARMKMDTLAFKKEKEAEIHSLQMKLAEYYPDEDNVTSWENERQIYTCQKVQDAHKLASVGKVITESELVALRILVAKSMPEFYAFVDSKEHGLTDNEKNICLLIRLRFIPSEMASLLDLSVQNVTNLRSRINKKLFNQSGAKSLNTRLLAVT